MEFGSPFLVTHLALITVWHSMLIASIIGFH